MQGNLFTQSFHVPGTLSANLNLRWTVPADCQLIHVSAPATAPPRMALSSWATVRMTDAYLETADIGDSNVPNEFDLDDFVNDQFPHILDGTIVVITVDYDGSSRHRRRQSDLGAHLP